MRVAIVQAEVASGLEAGLELTRTKANEAAARGAKLIVFPETWIPGYPAWLDNCRDAALWDHAPVKEVFARIAENSLPVPGPQFDCLAETARQCDATLVVGISERVAQGPGRGTLYNSLLTIGPDGTLLNHHRKLMPTYTEKLVWGAGDVEGLRSVDTPAGRVSALAAGSIGCRWLARLSTNPARTSTWRCGRPSMKCTRSPAANMHSKGAAGSLLRGR